MENHAAYPYSRSQALQALAVLAVWGKRSGEDVISYFRRLYQGGLERPGSDTVWGGLVSVSCDFAPLELREYAEAAFAQGLVDEFLVDQDWLAEACADPELQLQVFAGEHTPITDVGDEVAWWGSFRTALDDDDELDGGPKGWASMMEPLDDDDEDDLDAEDYPDPSQPFLERMLPYRAPMKVGRNEPCPCGSGKKYKKCHGT